MSRKWVTKNGEEKQIYKGVVITKKKNGSYTWGFGETTLENVKTKSISIQHKHNIMEEFKPRKFVAIKDEFGPSDVGMSGMVITVQSLKKGKIYEEANPEFLSGNQKGVVIDDDGQWWYVGTKSFRERFAMVEDEDINDKN